MDSPINSQLPPSNDEFTQRAQSRRVELVLLSTLFLQVLLSGLMVTSLMMNSSKDDRNRAADFSPTLVEEKRYIVKYKDPATARGASLNGENAESSFTKQTKSDIQTELRANDIAVQNVPDKNQVDTAITNTPAEEQVVEALSNDPGVEYVEEDRMMDLFSAPNDTYYNTPRPGVNGFLWNLDLIKVPQAWDVTNGGSSSIKVAVIDSGVIGANIARENNFLPDTPGAIAQLPELAGTRFTDPTVIIGAEKVNGSCVSLGQNKILNGWYINNEHGSHVTSTIAQMTNNNAHASGVAHQVTIMPITMGTSCGAPMSAMADAIDLAVEKGVRVINISMGLKACSGWPNCTSYDMRPDRYYSRYIQEAVQRANDRGVLVVTSAGNDATRTNSFFLTSPANDPLVLNVGSVRADKKRAYYSSYKPYSTENISPAIINRGVDLMAPGGQTLTDEVLNKVPGAFPWQDSNNDGLEDGIIQSTINTLTARPTAIDIANTVVVRDKRWYCIKLGSDNYFRSVLHDVCGGMQGTSMASPHVAAVAALMFSVNPNLTPTQVKNILKQTAQKDFSFYNQLEYGAGIIDAFQAVTVAKSTGTTPTPTPTPVPTPTPTAIPTPTPTPTPSPVVTPTPTPSPVPSPSPRITPTPYPTSNPTPSPIVSPNPSFTPSPLPTSSPISTLIGDINGDGVVNALDYTILIENYLQSPLPNPKADLNGDGKVNSIDYARFVENYLKRAS